MTATVPGGAAPLPTARPTPFDPPADLSRLRAEEPVSRLSYPGGHTGWLVTGHALVRQVLADPRFSARNELRHNPSPGAPPTPPPPAPRGLFIGHDAPEHTRYRRLLTGRFTVRRMRRLTERVEQITAEHLDSMERLTPPVDLGEVYASPIPALVIAELLGVPDHAVGPFHRTVAAASHVDSTPEEKFAAYTRTQDILRELVADKRAAPTDDLLGDLAADSDLEDDELTNIAFLLLGAGLDTTANMLGLGVLLLLGHPEQLAALREGPERSARVVEELLRYLSIVPFTTRTALEDLELGGRRVRAGETVTVSIAAANRDPDVFAAPDSLDPDRPAGGHLAFGHGIHQCLGQQLARVEMQVAYPALFARFPDLRPAVPEEEVPTREDMAIYGVHRLPVTWGRGRA
ncbi:cytochrome P450 [Nocardiopsis changdeensis]|uniref:Cytochrome P450 n=1 Tax=Nocardiopsis changdeensis TaxID=2831969 RepID=A0ABX8BWT0_9ACTN|nr:MULTISPECIES: cytochrome P450 [Nocardiopsis]QUX25258.1 cytochrome P450 [Nocardiopsis changdeensis]QYX35645.1 cytochrome P450 [Nocardiopsis sp. MT53]